MFDIDFRPVFWFFFIVGTLTGAVCSGLGYALVRFLWAHVSFH